MQVSVENKEGLDHLVTVTVPAEMFGKAYKAEINDLSRKIRIDGFRRGHIPASVIAQRFGSRIFMDVSNELVDKTIGDALKETGLRMAGRPYNLVLPQGVPPAGQDFVYKITVDVWPEVELKPFEDLRVKSLKTEISDADVDEVVEFLRRRKSKWEVRDGMVAADNCMAVIDFVARTEDGKEISGMSAHDMPLYLFSAREEEFIFRTLCEQVRGHKAGDQFTVALRFPQDEVKEELRGRRATLEITLKSVSEAQLPELNEEFIKEFGLGNTREDFRNALCSQMKQQLSGSRNNDKFQLLFIKLKDHDGEFEVPFSSYNLVKLKNIKCEISEEDIDRMIESLRWQQSKWQVKDGLAAARGTMVKLDYTVKVDGQELASEAASGVEVVVEGGVEPFPGLSDQLKEHKAGDRVEFKTRLPETWKNAGLRGKDADITATLISVSESVLPEVNADFIRIYGVKDGSPETFRKVLRSNMERELNNVLYTRRKNLLSAAVKYQYGSFDVPASVLQTYIDSLSENLAKFYTDRGVSREELKTEDLRNAVYNVALDQLRFNIILRRVADQYQLGDVSSEDIRQRVELNASMFEVPEEYTKQVLADKKQTRGIHDTLVDEKLVDFILSKACSEDLSLSYAELCGTPR